MVTHLIKEYDVLGTLQKHEGTSLLLEHRDDVLATSLLVEIGTKVNQTAACCLNVESISSLTSASFTVLSSDSQSLEDYWTF